MPSDSKSQKGIFKDRGKKREDIWVYVTSYSKIKTPKSKIKKKQVEKGHTQYNYIPFFVNNTARLVNKKWSVIAETHDSQQRWR